jgi:spore coat protein A
MPTKKRTKSGRRASTLTLGFQRRDFLKLSGAAGLTATIPWSQLVSTAHGAALVNSLSDPATQSKFVELAPNALDPGFKYTAAPNGEYTVGGGATTQFTGLVNRGGKPVATRLYGYGQADAVGYTWPGRTFEVQSGETNTVVNWENDLFGITEHLLRVDTSLHWAYSLPGYEDNTIANTGIPIVMHLHGGHSDFQFDGNPEFFFNPGASVVGPQWDDVPGGFTNQFVYDNDVPAGTLWYHDHALGITRLNVYAGMAGFYIVRDAWDTGLPGNLLGLPAFPYELAYAIQDRMFKKGGQLFYPALPPDPFWDDFITGEGLGNGDVPKPSALAEFFGDHMVVNGKIWPKADVEPRNYRLRLLNGCDSRFLVVQFFDVPLGATDFTEANGPLDFTVIGSDQGLAASPTTVQTLLIETGSRYDVVFNFQSNEGRRVIMKNIGGDAPFGGDFGDDLSDEDLFPDRQTDRIMAFDVVLPLDDSVPDVSPTGINFGPVVTEPNRTRKVALFEGKDEFGRLQPLLGTAELATDSTGAAINWPDTPAYKDAGLEGQMEGSIAWHSPTTENPALDTTEKWEIWNVTGDAHPVHLHLVHFEILGRQEIKWDTHTTEEDRVIPNGVHDTPAGNGTYLVTQPVVQHNGDLGEGFRIVSLTYGDEVTELDGYVENAPKDMVTALPGQITRIKMTFDKPGRYVWHCHILSHEDHEMMRVLHVGPGA